MAMPPATRSQRWALLAYAFVLRLFTPFYLARIYLRGREEPDYRQAWWRRLGFYEGAYRQQWTKLAATTAGPVVWVHAVSLGEARAAEPLIKALRGEIPGMRLLLTHGTATGMQAGQALLQASDIQTWQPWDTPGAVARFLRMHQPAVGVLMETEVWPVMLQVAEQQGVPMVLANARLSDKSLRQGQRLSALMQPAAWRMAAVLAQTKEDAQRVRTLKYNNATTVDKDIVEMGNIKFDMTPAPAVLSLGQAWRQCSQDRPMVLAASTREGEEADILAAWQTIQQQAAAVDLAQQARLLIVPRHPQRFDEVAALLEKQGVAYSRRSQWPQHMPDAQALQADVWLGDSLGEMPAYYASAYVALLGGSFAPLGGQNLIEAAACGCLIIMGPSTFNFEQAAELSEKAGSAWRVSDVGQAVQKAWEVCALPYLEVQRLQQTCYHFSQIYRGAAKRMAQTIAKLAA